MQKTCKTCKKEFETSYAPDRPETIYCEKCYQQELKKKQKKKTKWKKVTKK
jgi:rRNA maturation endonuclease Nob1